MPALRRERAIHGNAGQWRGNGRLTERLQEAQVIVRIHALLAVGTGHCCGGNFLSEWSNYEKCECKNWMKSRCKNLCKWMLTKERMDGAGPIPPFFFVHINVFEKKWVPLVWTDCWKDICNGSRWPSPCIVPPTDTATAGTRSCPLRTRRRQNLQSRKILSRFPPLLLSMLWFKIGFFHFQPLLKHIGKSPMVHFF